LLRQQSILSSSKELCYRSIGKALTVRTLKRVRKLSQADKDLMSELKSVVLQLVADAQVMLYGSAARGHRSEDSDYDVVVLTRRRLSPEEARELDRAIYELQLERAVVLSVMVYALEDWESPILRSSPYRKNVLKDGILV
jgi:uncharacterized protein